MPHPRIVGKRRSTDVFISYARADQEFVTQLAAALSGRGLDAWVDLEDIRKTADWWVTIERGIESANAFVSVLSPDLAASEVCRQETAFASEHDKRFVPIVRREAGRDTLPGELHEPNWIWFRDEDDFDGSLEQLVDALANDNDWLDAHARLLVRAGEWERDRPHLTHGKSRSPLKLSLTSSVQSTRVNQNTMLVN